MATMRKAPNVFILACLVLVASGCSLARPAPTPQPLTTQPEQDSLVNSCALLNTRDLASLFPTHTETILPKPQIAHVDHPTFSSAHAAGTETSCVFYSFYLPGSRSEVVLQVNYWLDRPATASAGQAWNQDWAAATAMPAPPLVGADGSFSKDGRLSFRKGNLYATVQATETDWNLATPSGVAKQGDLEQRVAVDMLNHLR